MAATDPGELRIVITDASETVKTMVFQCSSELLAIGETDPRLRQMLTMSKASVAEDSKIKIEYYTDTATSVDASACALSIPIRTKNTATGAVYESFMRAGTILADTSVPANTWVEIGSYTVKAQEIIRFGHITAENSRIYASLVES